IAVEPSAAAIGKGLAALPAAVGTIEPGLAGAVVLAPFVVRVFHDRRRRRFNQRLRGPRLAIDVCGPGRRDMGRRREMEMMEAEVTAATGIGRCAERDGGSCCDCQHRESNWEL